MPGLYAQSSASSLALPSRRGGFAGRTLLDAQRPREQLAPADAGGSRAGLKVGRHAKRTSSQLRQHISELQQKPYVCRDPTKSADVGPQLHYFGNCLARREELSHCAAMECGPHSL